jgi:hypothetical protein
MRKLKLNLDDDREQGRAFLQSSASYHRPTITYLSYKNTVKSARDPVSFSSKERSMSSSRSLCDRYYNAIDTPKPQVITTLPKLEAMLSERAARASKKVFKVKKEIHYSLLTLKALGIRKIPDEDEPVHVHQKEREAITTASAATSRKSLPSASLDPERIRADGSLGSFVGSNEMELPSESVVMVDNVAEYLMARIDEDKITLNQDESMAAAIAAATDESHAGRHLHEAHFLRRNSSVASNFIFFYTYI